eukprot:scaffold117721_cov20-Tisochrysis_lutea.AAC.2
MEDILQTFVAYSTFKNAHAGFQGKDGKHKAPAKSAEAAAAEAKIAAARWARARGLTGGCLNHS